MYSSFWQKTIDPLEVRLKRGQQRVIVVLEHVHVLPRNAAVCPARGAC